MSQLLEQQMESVVCRFRVKGKIKQILPFGSGHINRTYIVTMTDGGEEKRYTLQLINTSVFRNPDELMENIQNITAHIRRKLRGRGRMRNAARYICCPIARENTVTSRMLTAVIGVCTRLLTIA